MNRVKLPGKWVQVRMKTRPRTPKWKGGGGGAGKEEPEKALPRRTPIPGCEHCITPLRDHTVFGLSRKEPSG